MKNGSSARKQTAATILFAVWSVLNRLKETSVTRVKIAAAQQYLKSVEMGRRLFIEFALVSFCVLLLTISFVIIPFALLFFLPWEMQHKAIAALVLGLMYLCVPSFVLAFLLSEKRWLKLSRSEHLMEDFLESH